MMHSTSLARKLKRSRRPAAAALPGLAMMLLSLGACAGEQPGSRPSLLRVLESNLLPGPPSGPPIDAGSAAGSYLVGRFALGAGDYSDAADNLDEALAADPENLDLRRQVFLLRLANGDYDRAVAAASALVASDATAVEPLLILALDRAKKGDYAGARDLLGKLDAHGATGLVVPVLDAWAAYGAGAVDDGLARLSVAGSDRGLDLLRRYHRALMLELAHRPAEGLPVLAEIERRPDGLPLRVVQTLAQLRLELNDREGAQRTLDTALAADPGDPQLLAARDALDHGQRLVPVGDPRSAMADAMIGVAEALLEQQAGPQGLLLARAAGFLAPEMMDTHLIVGRILLDQDSPAEAEKTLAMIPDSAPQSWTARLLRAQALRDLNRNDEAASLLRAMAAERPQRTDVLVALGDLSRRDQKFAEAEQAYGEAISRLGAKVGRDDWRLFYARGMALERLDRWPEAEALLQKALELQPEQPMVLNYLGYSWVDKGLNLDKAKQMLHRAVELKPEDGFVVDSLGWAYFRTGEFDKAVTYLERAAELEAGDPVINDHLGDAYWRTGREREARFQWQRALSFKPEPDVATQIQVKLDHGLPGADAKRG